VSGKIIKANKSLTSNLIQEIASLYIRIFDTLPLYLSLNEKDESSWETLLFSKHIAALIRRTGYLNNARTIDHICYWKFHTEELEYLPGLSDIQRFINSTIDSLIK
jgi:hypothetical protein